MINGLERVKVDLREDFENYESNPKNWKNFDYKVKKISENKMQ